MIELEDELEILGVSVTKAAKALDCSNRQIYNLHERGLLRFFKVGSATRIPPADLRAIAATAALQPKVTA
jgi:excisionase family DNA binding protein